MVTRGLKTNLLLSFGTVIMALAVFLGVLGYYLIHYKIIMRTRLTVETDLRTARLVYNSALGHIKNSLELLGQSSDLSAARQKAHLDYLYFLPAQAAPDTDSAIVKTALRGRACGGTRIISVAELERMDKELLERSRITVVPTPKAGPSRRDVLTEAMALEYALPVNGQGKVVGVLYAGKVINRDFGLVDEIHDMVFENQLYQGKPTGTVTIFQDDVRISTNVLDSQGRRAVGTRVSQEVYRKVVGEGRPWLDRAFVVTDWYVTAYEPIKNINGEIIGILYVGILEKPFADLQRNFILAFLAMVVLAGLAAAGISYALAASIYSPAAKMVKAIEKLSQGDLTHRINDDTRVRELNELALAFDHMADKLYERDNALKSLNDKLAGLNKSYVDMIGFVSHELKGVLGSVVMSVYSLKDGYLGELNERQKKAVESAAKSLDHFENMVRNYLDLSRIEKGELKLTTTTFNLSEDVLAQVVESFEKQCRQKGMRLEAELAAGVKVNADKSLLTIVCNNLLGNAVKYGFNSGLIRVQVRDADDIARVCFYNDGAPIPPDQETLLFRRFSRLPGSENVKGTGLGLFIVREIIERHGGKVWVAPGQKGNEFVFEIPRERRL